MEYDVYIADPNFISLGFGSVFDSFYSEGRYNLSTWVNQ